MRAGDLARAHDDLTRACREKSRRVGSWIALALLALERDDRVGLRAALDEIRVRARTLLADAARACGRERFELERRPDDAREVLERSLTMLRGNRSSSLVTYFVDDELRFVPLDRYAQMDDQRELERLATSTERIAGLRPTARVQGAEREGSTSTRR
jgi:hypothetical protein